MAVLLNLKKKKLSPPVALAHLHSISGLHSLELSKETIRHNFTLLVYSYRL